MAGLYLKNKKPILQNTNNSNKNKKVQMAGFNLNQLCRHKILIKSLNSMKFENVIYKI